MTAFGIDDALELIKEAEALESLPSLLDVIEDVDVRTLDAGHVRHNVGPPNGGGVWHPMTSTLFVPPHERP